MKINVEILGKNKSTKELLEFGIINIDKSSGPTSFNVSDLVRKRLSPFGVRKTSHFGTLDPKVTGVLPIALNRACKLTGFFLGEDKEYVGIMRFHEDISLEKVRKAIGENFTGKIMQKPPVKSRVKRQLREREVKEFEIIEKSGNDFLFHATVEGGTYIRKLIDDLGKSLGVGAHMLELRRTRAGLFREEKSFNLYEFSKAVDDLDKGNESPLRKMITPAEIVSDIYPLVCVKEESVKRLLTGKPIGLDDLEKKVKIEAGKIISVFFNKRFVGMYRVVNEKDVFAKPEFVMQEIK